MLLYTPLPRIRLGNRKGVHVMQYKELGTSLVAQWMRLCAPNAGSQGSIPGQGTRSHMCAAAKSLHAATKEPACRN